MEYDNHLDVLGERNSYSKADLDAFFHFFQHRYSRLPSIGVADFGYGSGKITGLCKKTG